MHVNLLPKSFVWRRTILRRLRQWGLFFGVLMCALVCWKTPLVQKWSDHHHAYQEIHGATVHIRDMQVERVKTAKEVVALEQKISQLRQSVSSDRTTSILGIIAKGVHATEGQVQIQDLHVLVSPKANDASNLKDQAVNRDRKARLISTTNRSTISQLPSNEYRLTLRGIAIRSESITTFVESLQKSGAFPTVELRSTQERIVSERSVQEFQLECLGYE
jgi:hypothetical protein